MWLRDWRMSSDYHIVSSRGRKKLNVKYKFPYMIFLDMILMCYMVRQLNLLFFHFSTSASQSVRSHWHCTTKTTTASEDRQREHLINQAQTLWFKLAVFIVWWMSIYKSIHVLVCVRVFVCHPYLGLTTLILGLLSSRRHAAIRTEAFMELSEYMWTEVEMAPRVNSASMSCSSCASISCI